MLWLAVAVAAALLGGLLWALRRPGPGRFLALQAVAALQLMPLVRTGGFIPSVDHQTPPGVSLEHYRFYLRLLNDYTSNR